MVNKTVARAKRLKYHMTSILELPAEKWLIGYELAKELKKQGHMDEDTFLGVPYLLDYKEKETLLLATDPCQK